MLAQGFDLEQNFPFKEEPAELKDMYRYSDSLNKK